MAKKGLDWNNFAAASVVITVFLAVLAPQAWAYTDRSHVLGLEDLYGALNYPPQLKGWRVDGGDPCGESWTGVSCDGSSVIHLKLPGLNLTGYLGTTRLYFLENLKHLDVSFNNIVGEIPYVLPPSATHINLACNNFSQNIPHSLPTFLRHLNVSHNLLSGPIGNVFSGLQNLKEMDLSYNNFSGDLPSSFVSLTNLTGLFLENNHFTGSVIYLADLPLIDLNIQSNHFSGVIPTQFKFIQNLWIDGNKFHIGANYPPWSFPLEGLPYMQNFSGPPISESSAVENYPSLNLAGGHNKKNLGPGGIACVVGGVILGITFVAVYITVRMKQSDAFSAGRTRESDLSLHSLPVKSPLLLGPRHKPFMSHGKNEKFSARKSFCQGYEAPLSAKIYNVAELQSATNGFSEDNLLREGSLGSVYRAEFPDGQILAVENINMVSLSFQEEEQFLNVVWTATRLRHRNILTLVGYCVEHGQHLVVYEHVRNTSLDEFLHSEDYAPLSWTSRLDIALGVARALDYLHSTFSPPVAYSNIKAANILVDEELVPYLCDCGLAILRPLTSNSVKLKASEIAIDDTGYTAHEHGEPGTDGTKSDIYAFGVLLLELLTGMRPFERSRPRGKQSLVKWAASQLHDSESLVQMVDPSIKSTLSSKTLSEFADVVSLCIQPEKLFRPPMSDIVESLTCLLTRFNSSSETESAKADPFSRSFCSPNSFFATSPTQSRLSF